MDGVVNFNKPQNMTSHDAVGFMRRLTDIRRIGHTGTLDPMATGVLPICIGKATRLIEYMKDDKRYSATIKLGYDSETQDIWGSELIHVSLVKMPSHDDVTECIKNFQGQITQRVPGFSAQKHEGRKLYEYARSGEKIPVKTKEVNIYSIEITLYDPDNYEIGIDVHCSKGTYIRTICSDIGKRLGTAAVMSKLNRTEAGALKFEDSVTIEELENEKKMTGNINKYIKKVDNLLVPERLDINADQARRFYNGLTIDVPVTENKEYTVYETDLVGIGRGTYKGLKPHKVLREKTQDESI